jgi:hypothetical protein
MIYICWAAMYEGEMDAHYLNALIPRVMTDLVLRYRAADSIITDTPAVRLSRGSVEDVAEETCKARGAFHLVFVHADTGGRNVEADLSSRATAYYEAMRKRCNWNPVRCVMITPRY